METSDSFAYIRFVSDAVQNAAGFRLSFEASVEGNGVHNWLGDKKPFMKCKALSTDSYVFIN